MINKRNLYNFSLVFQFVAHPNVQQLLASIWYEGLPGFRQLNMVLQFLEVCRIGLLFPFFSICYIVCPWWSFSQKLRKPFIKFICSSSSYFTFLCKYMQSKNLCSLSSRNIQYTVFDKIAVIYIFLQFNTPQKSLTLP